eukprot:Skav204798  [mRNA]  locus=scaffold763:460514:465506:+ [translate_table: standard]
MTSSEWQLVKGGSDKETTPGSSPRMQQDSEDESPCRVVVKGTFIEVTNGSSLLQRFQKFRKSKTDSVLDDSEEDIEELVLSDLKKSSSAEKVPVAVAAQTEQDVTKDEPLPELAKGTTERSSCPAGKTTVMMRNIPNNYTRRMFLELLNKHGLQSCYDFIYLPYDFQRASNLGYAFVNLREDAVDMFWQTFDGFSQWSLPSSKVCKVTWSGPHQGFEAHVERYRNSPVMHRSVPDEYKPLIFSEGTPIPFPPPTRRLKAPTTR